MGLGYWLTEEISFDADSGELTTCNTWVSNISLRDVIYQILTGLHTQPHNS